MAIISFATLSTNVVSAGSTMTPAGPAGATHNDQSSNLHQSTVINIAGVEGGHESVGATVARYQSGVNADLLRQLQGSSVG
jgi:hypothetical protein